MIDDDCYNDYEIFLRSAWPMKGIELYFQLGPLTKISIRI